MDDGKAWPIMLLHHNPHQTNKKVALSPCCRKSVLPDCACIS